MTGSPETRDVDARLEDIREACKDSAWGFFPDEMLFVLSQLDEARGRIKELEDLYESGVRRDDDQ